METAFNIHETTDLHIPKGLENVQYGLQNLQSRLFSKYSKQTFLLQTTLYALPFVSDWLAWLRHDIVRWGCSWNLSPKGYQLRAALSLSQALPQHASPCACLVLHSWEWAYAELDMHKVMRAAGLSRRA